ncbi:hypothetical protein ZWY2020_035778 [Hordeum vulgare]|nr:hypothetical protein ZWY2020_035778 [Hordeum vulgare]
MEAVGARRRRRHPGVSASLAPPLCSGLGGSSPPRPPCRRPTPLRPQLPPGGRGGRACSTLASAGRRRRAEEESPYEVLGVSPSAAPVEIKGAYRRYIALKYHRTSTRRPAIKFQNWEAGLNSEQKPKSLWEELSAIGEEFVEFLENRTEHRRLEH